MHEWTHAVQTRVAHKQGSTMVEPFSEDHKAGTAIPHYPLFYFPWFQLLVSHSPEADDSLFDLARRPVTA